MQFTNLGLSGLSVPRLSLGTMMWGHGVSLDVAGSQLRAYLGAGGTCVETGPDFAEGESIAILGELCSTHISRSDLLLCLSGTPQPFRAPEVRASAASRHELLAALDSSLRALGTDHVDVWTVPLSSAVPVHETLSAMEWAYRSGRARYLGVSTSQAWLYAHATTLAEFPVVAVSSEYSLLDRVGERELFAATQLLGASVIDWSPLAHGVLSGKYQGKRIPADSRATRADWEAYLPQYWSEHDKRIVESVRTAASGLDISPVSVALAWVFSRPEIATVVVGTSTTAQLTEILKGAFERVPTEIIEVLAEVSQP